MTLEEQVKAIKTALEDKKAVDIRAYDVRGISGFTDAFVVATGTAAPHLKALIDKWNAMAPMGRLGKPEELESICVYLAGDTSTFTNGSDFVIDGAFTCF